VAHPTSGLDRIDHVVVIMLENRSFDHMLGFLYSEEGNVSPLGHPFEGLTGNETNEDKDGNVIKVWRLDPSDPYCYFTPRADPGEGFANTSAQLWDDNMVVEQKKPPDNSGFVKNYQYTMGWEPGAGFDIYPGASAKGILAMHTPETLPVMSALARGYAVCDHWYCSAPTETQPNRAFMHMATSEGLIHNDWKYPFRSKSICGALGDNGQSWAIYAYDTAQMSYTRFDIADLLAAPDSNFGTFDDFKTAAASGKLANYSFLEPKWGTTGNSMHPNYNVASGEQYLKEIYETVRSSPCWEKTLLVVTFDEHGGCYDHVAPPTGAVPPDGTKAPNGFAFDRFGVRVPTILVSPWIEAGTVHRAPGRTPFDHTSILRTVGVRWGFAPLTRRDAAAPDVGGVFTLDAARTDDVLASVAPPTASLPTDKKQGPGHLEKGLVERANQLPDPAEHGHHNAHAPSFKSGEDAVKWAAARLGRHLKHVGKSVP
jgi:phospholipase C